MTYLILNSDNFENEIVTEEAYALLRLEMSTGDFHTHKAVRLKKVTKAQKAKALTKAMILEEEAIAASFCHSCGREF